MYKLPISKTSIQEAEIQAADLGLLKNSISEGKGNVIGFLGEIMMAKQLGIEQSNTYDYDLKYQGYTIDVKTKLVNSAPKSHYEVSVSDHNTRQKCDFYLFVRIHISMKYGWILGMIKKTEFYEKAQLFCIGEMQTEGTYKFEFKSDTWNLPITALHDLEEYLGEN